MRKWMVEFLRKCESYGDKITQVISIRMTKFINLLLFCRVIKLSLIAMKVRCDADIFKLTARAQSIL